MKKRKIYIAKEEHNGYILYFSPLRCHACFPRRGFHGARACLLLPENQSAPHLARYGNRSIQAQRWRDYAHRPPWLTQAQAGKPDNAPYAQAAIKQQGAAKLSFAAPCCFIQRPCLLFCQWKYIHPARLLYPSPQLQGRCPWGQNTG